MFDYFRTHADEGTKVDVIHVDAHSDIGGGLFSGCWHYVLTEYLYLSHQQRLFPRRGTRALNCGNFLVFMAACGWINRITFVQPDGWSDDLNGMYLKDFGADPFCLQLRRYRPEDVAETFDLHGLAYEVDVEVPVEYRKWYKMTPDRLPDMIFVTRSPNFTPETADPLFERLSALIDV